MLICLVPERVFSQAPLDIHLVYLCRFEVRIRRRLLSGFSWQREIVDLSTPKGSFGTHLKVGFEPTRWICLPGPSQYARCLFHQADSTILLRPRIVITSPPQCRNINRLSIGYAFRPRLRYRLTLSGLTFLRKP